MQGGTYVHMYAGVVHGEYTYPFYCRDINYFSKSVPVSFHPALTASPSNHNHIHYRSVFRIVQAGQSSSIDAANGNPHHPTNDPSPVHCCGFVSSRAFIRTYRKPSSLSSRLSVLPFLASPFPLPSHSLLPYHISLLCSLSGCTCLELVSLRR